MIQRIVGNFLFYDRTLAIPSYYSACSRFCLPCYELKMLVLILFLILFFEIQMLLRCCFIHTSISKLIHLYLLYLCSCLELGPFMPYPCDLFFIFIIIFIMINLKNTDTLDLLTISQSISHSFWMITCMKNFNNFQIAIGQPYGVAKYLLNFFCQFSMVLLIKKLLIKKACI